MPKHASRDLRAGDYGAPAPWRAIFTRLASLRDVPAAMLTMPGYRLRRRRGLVPSPRVEMQPDILIEAARTIAISCIATNDIYQPISLLVD